MSKRRGRLVVVSAPSGAGKTTLVRGLIERDDRFVFSVSYTTRPMRPNERPGVDYHFVDKAEFLRLRDQQAFLEYAEVFDNYYATGREAVAKELKDGRNVIVEIDWQGAQQVRQQMPKCCSIFIVPPSIAALRERLTRRQTDTQDIIERRLRDSLSDLSHWTEFDYIVVNDHLDKALDELAGIASGVMRRNRVGTDRVDRIMQAILSTN
ncbi:MAG: guanylate kinase [Pseudomonadota bacterium]